MKTKANKRYRSRRVRTYKKRTAKRVKRTTQRSGGPLKRWWKSRKRNQVAPIVETTAASLHKKTLPPTPLELKRMLTFIDTNGYRGFIPDEVRNKVAENKILTMEELSLLMEWHDLAKSNEKVNRVLTGRTQSRRELSEAEMEAELEKYQREVDNE